MSTGDVLAPEGLIGRARDLPRADEEALVLVQQLGGPVGFEASLEPLGSVPGRYETVYLGRQLAGFRPDLDLIGERSAPVVAEQVYRPHDGLLGGPADPAGRFHQGVRSRPASASGTVGHLPPVVHEPVAVSDTAALALCLPPGELAMTWSFS